jgi:hypothetical protein
LWVRAFIVHEHSVTCMRFKKQYSCCTVCNAIAVAAAVCATQCSLTYRLCLCTNIAWPFRCSVRVPLYTLASPQPYVTESKPPVAVILLSLLRRGRLPLQLYAAQGCSDTGAHPVYCATSHT